MHFRRWRISHFRQNFVSVYSWELIWQWFVVCSGNELLIIWTNDDMLHWYSRSQHFSGLIYFRKCGIEWAFSNVCPPGMQCPINLTCHWQDCCYFSKLRNHDISRYGSSLFPPEYAGFSPRRVNISGCTLLLTYVAWGTRSCTRLRNWFLL